MHETLYPVTRLHKLKRMEEEFLRRMNLDEENRSAYERNAQEFFTFIAQEQEQEQKRSQEKNPNNKHLRQGRVPYEMEQHIVMYFRTDQKTRWRQKEIAKSYNISMNQLQTILKKYWLQSINQ